MNIYVQIGVAAKAENLYRCISDLVSLFKIGNEYSFIYYEYSGKRAVKESADPELFVIKKHEFIAL